MARFLPVLACCGQRTAEEAAAASNVEPDCRVVAGTGLAVPRRTAATPIWDWVASDHSIWIDLEPWTSSGSCL